MATLKYRDPQSGDWEPIISNGIGPGATTRYGTSSNYIAAGGGYCIGTIPDTVLANAANTRLSFTAPQQSKNVTVQNGYLKVSATGFWIGTVVMWFNPAPAAWNQNLTATFTLGTKNYLEVGRVHENLVSFSAQGMCSSPSFTTIELFMNNGTGQNITASQISYSLVCLGQ